MTAPIQPVVAGGVGVSGVNNIPGMGDALSSAFLGLVQALGKKQELQQKQQELDTQRADMESQSAYRGALSEQARAETKKKLDDLKKAQEDLDAQNAARAVVQSHVDQLGDPHAWGQVWAEIKDPVVAGYATKFRDEWNKGSEQAANTIKAQGEAQEAADKASLRQVLQPELIAMMDPKTPEGRELRRVGVYSLLGATNLLVVGRQAAATDRVGLRQEDAQRYDQFNKPYAQAATEFWQEKKAAGDQASNWAALGKTDQYQNALARLDALDAKELRRRTDIAETAAAGALGMSLTEFQAQRRQSIKLVDTAVQRTAPPDSQFTRVELDQLNKWAQQAADNPGSIDSDAVEKMPEKFRLKFNALVAQKLKAAK